MPTKLPPRRSPPAPSPQADEARTDPGVRRPDQKGPAREPLVGLGGLDWQSAQVLGEGSTARVLRVQTSDGDPVVVKIAKTAASAGAIRREAETRLFLDSRHVPPVLAFGEHALERGASPLPFVVLPFEPGRTLDALVPHGDATAIAIASPSFVLRLARDLATALADLERAGLSHGDVKPANVWLSPSEDHADRWRAGLLDFGLSGSSQTAPEGGTPRYAAPELGSPSAERRLCDRYALAVVVGELLVPPSALEQHADSTDAAGPATAPPVARTGERLRQALDRFAPPSADLAPLWPLLRASLDPVPGKRPSPTLLAEVATRTLGEPRCADDSQGAIRTTYLALRRAELLAAARGAPSAEIAHGDKMPAFAARRVELLAALVGRTDEGERPQTLEIPRMDELGVRRLLARFLGPWSLPIPLGLLADADDEARLELLLSLASHKDPGAFSADDFIKSASFPIGASTRALTPHEATSDDPIALAIALSAPRPSDETLQRARALLDRARFASRSGLPHALDALEAALLRALGRRGDWAAALLTVPEAEAATARSSTRAMLGDLARKAGDRPLARRLVGTDEPSIAARVAYDEGDLPRARALLALAPRDDARAAEVRALVLLGEGAPGEAREAALGGLAVAREEESLARLQGTLGYIAHAQGDVAASLDAYRSAASAAARAGMVLEEATYLTGVAAAATDSGAFTEASTAARRAILLWESLGRRREAGRALLAQAAALRILGVPLSAWASAEEARGLSEESGDTRGAAFATLVMIDALPSDATPAVVSAIVGSLRSALDAPTGGLSTPSDRLRGAARLFLHGALSADERTHADRVASLASTDLVARLEWWTTRARVALDGFAPGLDTDGLDLGGASPPSDGATRSLAELPLLFDAPAPIDARASAAWVTARLSARLGDGPLTRRATALIRQLAAIVSAHEARPAELPTGRPHETDGSARAIAWWPEAQHGPAHDPLGRDDSTEILNLFRALTTQDSLREVLRQVLDALVLWTGVERGLLLLPVGEKLVPRAARNLSRDDLRGEQLALSLSLARRAFLTREPVVAVDALHDREHDLLASVHALKLRSVLAVPLLARGDVVGVVYLDDRLRRGAFGEREVSWVTLAAGAAALAIADTRDRALLRRAVRKAERARRLTEAQMMEKEAALTALERTRSPRAGIRSHPSTRAIIGTSPLLEDALRLVDRVAPSDLSVLLFGESGTGKELFARAVHEGSRRAKKRFVSESCAAIPENLLESTLFGHERGAFTGAVGARDGLFAVADGGTLFLDEVGELPLALQAKLLRVLQSGELRPVGANTARKVDVRIVAATHRDLPAEVREGRFREDLYYRLVGVLVKVPALRERQGDIPILVAHFLEKYAANGVRIAREAMEALVAYAFPGNVRQLENEIRRALALTAAGGTIELSTLSEEVRAPARASRARELSLHVRDRVDDLERELIREALARSGGNKTRAAELLGVSRFGLSKMEKRLALP